MTLHDQYTALLHSVAEASKKRPAPLPNLTLFSGRRGSSERGQIMFVGRAVNGWREPVDATLMSSAESMADLISDEVADGDPGSYPLDWVVAGPDANAGYNPSQSAFWRVIEGLCESLRTSDLGPGSDGIAPWQRTAAWTNLYKVSLFDGGNPPAWLSNAQFLDCVEILKVELAEWEPRKVVFLTGAGWFDHFASGIKFIEVGADQGGLAQRWGHCGSVEVVVAVHPQGKGDAEVQQAVEAAFLRLSPG